MKFVPTSRRLAVLAAFLTLGVSGAGSAFAQGTPIKLFGDGVQLISVPFDYASLVPTVLPSEIFGISETGDNDGDGTANTAADRALFGLFRIADWTGVDYKIGKDIPVLVGKAYFVEFGAVARVPMAGGALPGETFAINLAPGWNLIGHPFADATNPAIPGPDIDLYASATITAPNEGTGETTYSMIEAVQLGLVKGTLFEYSGSRNGSQYLSTALMKPWKGYWFLNSNSRGVPLKLTLRYPSTRGIAPPERVTRLANRRNDWRLQIGVRQGDLRDTFNRIGVAPGASDHLDHAFDQPKPPLPGGVASVYLAFSQADVRGRSVPCADAILAPGGAKAWDFTVTANRAGEVVLYWPDIQRLPQGLEPVLIDRATGRRVSMRTAPYRFLADGQQVHRFRIEVKPARTATLALLRTRVQSAGGRSLNGGYRVSFVATQEAQVEAEVRTIGGKALRRLQTRALAGQESTLFWDGKDQTGASLPAGAYVLTLTARDEAGAAVRQSVPLITVR